MEKKHSLTRIAASLLLLPILHLAVTGLLYGGLAITLEDPVSTWLFQIEWLSYLSDILYVLFVIMAMYTPAVIIGTSAVGITLMIRGMRRGESKKMGILVISAFVLFIALLIAACIALMWSLISSGGIGS